MYVGCYVSPMLAGHRVEQFPDDWHYFRDAQLLSHTYLMNLSDFY